MSEKHKEESNGQVFGSGKSSGKCSICGKIYSNYGNNPWPINEGRCCDKCNLETVLPARVKLMQSDPERFRERTHTAEELKSIGIEPPPPEE